MKGQRLSVKKKSFLLQEKAKNEKTYPHDKKKK